MLLYNTCVLKFIFTIKKSLNNQHQLVQFDSITNKLKVQADSMNLNQTDGSNLSLDLYVVKGSRVSVSQRMEIGLNLSSVLAISTNTDVKELSRQLDKLDDFAKKYPAKALTLLSSFVDVINAKADDISQKVCVNLTTLLLKLLYLTLTF